MCKLWFNKNLRTFSSYDIVDRSSYTSIKCQEKVVEKEEEEEKVATAVRVLKVVARQERVAGVAVAPG